MWSSYQTQARTVWLESLIEKPQYLGDHEEGFGLVLVEEERRHETFNLVWIQQAEDTRRFSENWIPRVINSVRENVQPIISPFYIFPLLIFYQHHVSDRTPVGRYQRLVS